MVEIIKSPENIIKSAERLEKKVLSFCSSAISKWIFSHLADTSLKSCFDDILYLSQKVHGRLHLSSCMKSRLYPRCFGDFIENYQIVDIQTPTPTPSSHLRVCVGVHVDLSVLANSNNSTIRLTLHRSSECACRIS